MISQIYSHDIAIYWWLYMVIPWWLNYTFDSSGRIERLQNATGVAVVSQEGKASTRQLKKMKTAYRMGPPL